MNIMVSNLPLSGRLQQGALNSVLRLVDVRLTKVDFVLGETDNLYIAHVHTWTKDFERKISVKNEPTDYKVLLDNFDYKNNIKIDFSEAGS